MSFKHGRNAGVWLGGTDMSPYLTGADFSVDVETADVTTFGSSWKAAIPGMASSTVETTGYFDPTVTDLWNTIGDADQKVLTVMPAGTAQGDAARLFLVDTSAYSETAPVDDVVGFAWGVNPSDNVGIGHVIAAAQDFTVDASTSAFDGGAATTNGAVAHLHVFSVSAADTVDVYIDDSADGTTGWSSIGSFTTASAAGAERIEIAGTVRRYVRVTADVTGTDVTINLGVALARL